jgi:hypothetical protein
MAVLTASVGRGGANKTADVSTVQSLLNRHISNLGLARLTTDGKVGPKTLNAIEVFQRTIVGLARPDGRVDPRGATHRALDSEQVIHPRGGSPSREPSSGGGTVSGAVRSPNWPPRPSFAPLNGNDARARLFGRFQYVAAPLDGNPENVRITDDWERRNIVTVQIDMGPHVGTRNVRFHRLAADQLQRMWRAWGNARLLDRVLSYEGSFVPRFIRGSTTNLSNHSFGSAFDINARWNGLNAQPALLGERGCVRELVSIANEHGFYWGGHFNRLDGMHFEVARLMEAGRAV